MIAERIEELVFNGQEREKFSQAIIQHFMNDLKELKDEKGKLTATDIELKEVKNQNTNLLKKLAAMNTMRDGNTAERMETLEKYANELSSKKELMEKQIINMKNNITVLSACIETMLSRREGAAGFYIDFLERILKHLNKIDEVKLVGRLEL